MQEAAVEIEKNGTKESSSLSIFEEGPYYHFENIKGTSVSLPETGVIMTRKAAENQEVTVGDTVKWRLYGSTEWHTDRVEEIIQTPLEQGIYMSSLAYENSGGSFRPTAFVTSEKASAFSGEGYETIQTKEDLIHSLESMLEMMNALIFIMIGAAVILGLVVLYNLGVLSFQEKMREMATLKVLGFHHKRLAKLLRQQTIWLTLLGILAGIPCGYGMVAYMLLFMGDTLDMRPQVQISSYVFSSVGIFAISLLVGWVVSRKLKKIDMVSALKSIE